MGYVKLVATAASVCTSLRSALLEPEAESLWRFQLLCGSYPGLSAQQRQQMHRLLARQGHHARSVTILGANWDARELEQSLATLTGLTEHLQLHDMDSAAQAACYAPLLASSVTSLRYRGTEQLLSPLSCTLLSVNIGYLLSAGPQQYLDCLRPLKHLQVLTLVTPARLLCGSDAELLASQHPHLSQLRLTLLADNFVGDHAVSSLPGLQARLSLNVITGNSLTALLHELRGVRLEKLEMWLSSAIGLEHEALLAQCNFHAKLIFRCLSKLESWRLVKKLPGVSVEYWTFAGARLA